MVPLLGYQREIWRSWRLKLFIQEAPSDAGLSRSLGQIRPWPQLEARSRLPEFVTVDCHLAKVAPGGQAINLPVLQRCGPERRLQEALSRLNDKAGLELRGERLQPLLSRPGGS